MRYAGSNTNKIKKTKDIHSVLLSSGSHKISSLDMLLLRSSVLRAVRAPLKQQCRSLSANAKVWVNKDTRVICQGFTGKQVRNTFLFKEN